MCNQLLRAGTSIGANNAEATSAISKADFKSKSYIALKEARESIYWIELLHRNGYLSDEQFDSIYADAEELVKVLTHRCKKSMNNYVKISNSIIHPTSDIIHLTLISSPSSSIKGQRPF